ncbi:SBBP repeat-containing protein [Parasediminibacterium sp. JCM 36343]|uniref:SBBP repeat-containing protein n=1 Tax=Parasediminibacterium sp. JCM 36343 TaxID=3374279 RepID=UPI00397B35F3
MKKQILLLLLAIGSLSAMAQPYHAHFLKKITATGYGPTSFKCVAYDKRGNIYAAGSFRDTATFDNGTKLVSTEYSEDIVIAKFDRKGKTIWAKKAGGRHDIETAHDIAVDSNNNVYIVGFAQGNAKFDNIIINQDTAAGEHGFLAKLDSNGNYKWVKGGIAFEYNAYIAKQTALYIDKNNNLFFGGSITNQVTSKPYFDGVVFTNIDCCNSNVFLWKMDGNGSILARFEPARNFDFITGITGDSKGNILVVGGYTCSDSTNAGALQIVAGTPIKNVKGSYASGYNSGYTLKLDNNLKTQWIKPNWGSANSVPTGIAVDSLDNVYVGGTYSDSVQIGTGKLNAGQSATNIFYAKFNASGTFQWAKNYGDFGTYGYDAYRLAYDKANDKLWATIHTNNYPVTFSGIDITHYLAICEVNKANGAITTIIQNTTDPDVKATGLAVWKKNVAVVGSYVTGFPGVDTTVTILGLHVPISYNEPEDGFIFEFTDTTTLLPVDIVSVKAYPKATVVSIEWSVQNEINIDHYEVEKSNDGIAFGEINSIKAFNTANAFTYTSIDANPFDGATYYRIKIVSKEGNLKYTPIVVVNASKAASVVRAYPNPITHGNLYLQLSNMEKGNYSLQLFNTLGQSILTQAIVHEGGSSNRNIVLPGKLTSGNYFLQVKGGSGFVYNQELLVK